MNPLFPNGQFDAVAALNMLAAMQPPPASDIPQIEQAYGVKWDVVKGQFVKQP